MKLLKTLALLALLLSPLYNVSAGTVESIPPRTQSAKGSQYTPATIKKIDKDNGKVTLMHYEIKNLDMPAMTMVFKLADKTNLDNFKVGEDVDVVFEKTNQGIVVKEILKP